MNRFILFAALMLAGCASTPPATDREVGVVRSQRGDSVTLYADQGECPQGAKRALYAYPPQARMPLVEGCWFEQDEMVHTVWRDGDAFSFPRAVFFGEPKPS